MLIGNTVSKQDWQGLHSQKFKGGRLHIKPQDQLGSVIFGKDLPFKGRKHFEESYSEEQKSKSFLRLFDQKNKESLTSQGDINISKLQYIPPQRKARLDVLEQMGSKTKESKQDKFHRKIGMMTLKTYNQYNEKKQEEQLKLTQMQQQSQLGIKNLSSNNLKQYTWQQRDQIEQASQERMVIVDLEEWADEKIYEKKIPKSLYSSNKPISRGVSNSQASRRSKATTISRKDSLQNN